MNVHDEIESLTDVYLAGGLEEGERREIEEHAATCDACAGVLRDATEFHGWMKGASEADAPPFGLEDRVIANLRAASPARSSKLRSLRWLAGVAAIFGLIVIGGIASNSDEVAKVQSKLVARSGVEVHAGHTPALDAAYISAERDGLVAGVNAYGKQLEEQLHASRESVKTFTSYIGGEGGGFRGRVGETRKNWADKAPATLPAPNTGALQEYTEESERNDSADMPDERKVSGDLEKKGKDQRPETVPFVDDRKIIRNADLHLEVDEYEKSYKAIAEITRAKKGFIAGANTTKLANGKTRATVTLRIPPEEFEKALDELALIGTVRHKAITTADVTKHYQELSSRLESKQTLIERLKKVLLEGKGTVKELMEVEVQMGATIEQMEVIKGEIKYYDNLVSMSTITMQVFEKDMGLPFEYVQTLQSVITVRAFDADAKYAEAQKIILDAGGQVVQSQMARSNEESASGFVKGKVDAEKFPDVRGKLKALGQYVDQDTVNQQQTGRGGQGDAKPGAPVKKEQAVIDFTVNTPPVVVTRQAAVAIEASPAGTAYQAARQEVQAAGGEIVAGSFMDRTGGATAFVKAQIDEEKFAALVEKLKTLGKVKNATVKQDEPGSDSGRAPLLRKKGEIVFEITTPPPLIPEESGLGRVLRDTFQGSVAGLLWSVEKLFVGLALAGPWIVLALVVLVIWKKAKRQKASQTT